MIKIMLVEDDKSLREIYGVRLLAEGYDIVSAGDGEEALAMAIKERPHLIISDVMMPKISGFDMLDILRSTTETRNIKVIMMTALSSDDQRSRGEQLGADRYLVKSQVGIEDVVRVVHEVLGDSPQQAQPQPVVPAAPVAMPTPQTVPQPQQVVSTAPVAPAPSAPAPVPVTPPVQPQPAPAPTPLPKPTAPFSSPRPASLGERVIQPLKDNPRINDVDMNELIDKELSGQDAPAPAPAPETPTVATNPTEPVAQDINAELDKLIAQQAPVAPATPIFSSQAPAQAPTPVAPQQPAPTPQQPSTPAPGYQREASVAPPPRDPQAQYRPPTAP
ncbi:MAG TPA: response regulator [Candidatus Saccharimonadales bacterium]